MARKTKEEAQRTRQQIIDAARAVFHEHGVGRSSLEQVANAAGLTRGAVYWHFKDKAELFLAMREDVFAPLSERQDAILFSDEYNDPLEAIEASLKAFFQVLEECPTLRQVLEIMVLRCELVDEYAEVQAEVNRPGEEFLEKVEKAYEKASAQDALRAGLDPGAMARDTWAFVSGLLHALLSGGFDNKLKAQIPEMIAAHMSLRRQG
jgi:TetR/AcrR family acrAB operon transcriptional repressor